MELQRLSVGHENRIHRVLEFIDRRLDQSLELPELASVAHISTFHFHRLFSAYMSETPGDYLRRRRLEIGAIRLVSQPQLSILFIALSVGFGSAEAFARAFKLKYSCSPSAWRAQHISATSAGGDVQPTAMSVAAIGRPFVYSDAHTEVEEGPLSLDVKLVNWPTVTIAYRRYVGSYGQAVINFWQNNLYPWLSANELQQRPYYGIAHDYPRATKAVQCRYDGGAEVDEGFAAVGPCFKTTIPGGLYATTHFKGTIEEFRGVWASLLQSWLPSSGLRFDLRPRFEYFPAGSKFDKNTGVFECEICLPVSLN